MTTESMKNYIQNRIEYWIDQGLCRRAAELQANYEWTEQEEIMIDADINEWLARNGQ